MLCDPSKGNAYVTCMRPQRGPPMSSDMIISSETAQALLVVIRVSTKGSAWSAPSDIQEFQQGSHQKYSGWAARRFWRQDCICRLRPHRKALHMSADNVSTSSEASHRIG